jgi:putative FmdB family regulatory protein
MPLYEYECGSCGRRFERIQKFSDPPVTECPTCGGPVHKLVSSPAIQFKGSGFYITDYAKSGKSSETESSAKAGSADKPASEGGTKTDKTDSSTKSDSGSDSKSTETKKTEAPAKTSKD